MAKKKVAKPKAAKGNPKANPDKAKPKAKNSSSKRGVSALSFALIAFLGGIIATSVGITLALSDVGSSANEYVDTIASDDAKAIARSVAFTLSTEQERLQAISTTESIIEWGKTGDPSKQIDKYLADAYPQALKVEFFPRGHRKTNLEDTPPTGFAAIEMIEKAEETKKPPKLEVHFPSDATMRHVLFMQPVLDGESVVGTIALWQPTDDVLSQVRWLSPNGRLLQVEHKAPGGESSVIMDFGDPALETGSTQTAEVDGLPWTVKVKLRPVADSVLGIDTTILFIWGGLALVVQLIVAGGLYAILHGWLRADASVFRSIMSDLKQDKLALEYQAKLNEMDAAVAAITKDAWDIKDNRTAHVSPELANAASKGKAVFQSDSDESKKQAALDDLPPIVEEATEITEEADSAFAGLGLEPAPGLEVVDADESSADSLFDNLDANPAPVQAENIGDGNTGLPASIFRAYDIRGVVGETLNAEIVYSIGKAIGAEAFDRGITEIAVGRDGRLSGEEMQQALMRGILDSGVDVLNVGMVPTPVLYFAAHQYTGASGVMVTGSHNPPDYNGFKIMLGGETFSGELITGLRQRVLDKRLCEGQGQEIAQDVDSDYTDYITNDVTLMRPLKIVIDCGNGVAGKIAPSLFRELGCEVEELYCEVDGRFPNHHPDPSEPENLEAMMSLVRLQGADVGLAFDGDGDRLGVVDSKGNIIWADRQMMLFSKDVLMRNPGSDIIFDVKCTNQLAQVISENAGVPVMWKTGHSFVKKKLKETGAPLAGEMSGHIFFNERWFGFDDGIYAGCRLLEILSADDRKSDEIFGELPNSVNTPEIKVPMKEGEPAAFMEAFKQQANFPDASISNIDGVRADYSDGWGLVRASNTTPVLVCRFDASTEEALERIKGQFKSAMQSVKPDLMFPF